MKKDTPTPKEAQQEADKKVDFDDIVSKFKGMEAQNEDDSKLDEIEKRSGKSIVVSDEVGNDDTMTAEQHETLSKDVEEHRDNKIKEEEGLEQNEAEKQRGWEAFIRGIKMHDVLDGLLHRALESYEVAYNAINPDEQVKFKLSMHSNRQLTKGIVFDVSLVLTMTRGGKIYKISEKRIQFRRIRDAEDQAGWKYSLYQAMLDSLVTNAMNFYILKKDADSGRIKQDVPGATGGDQE